MSHEPRMNRHCLLCGLLLLLPATLRADEQTRSTQEELRRRNIFFGDIDGRPSREFEEALKRYQSRKGLATTGQRDRETLRSLGLAARDPAEPVPKALEWPEEPVLKSDARLDVAGMAAVISSASGVATASLLPEPVTTGSPSRRAVRHRKQTSKSASLPTDRTAPQVASFSTGQKEKLQPELAAYIRRYLQAVSRNRLQDELHFYADRVNYLGNGVVDRRLIEQSLRQYYQRWPRRNLTQTGEIGYQTVPSRGEIIVTFRTTFSMSNRHSRVKGQTANQIVINAATADPRIVSITERRVRM
jgi:hypothetical protein